MQGYRRTCADLDDESAVRARRKARRYLCMGNAWSTDIAGSRAKVTLSQRESNRFLDNAIAAINGLFAERASTEPVSISREGSARRFRFPTN
ncbi:hypothetical protein HZH68_013084 [Vespula germanica]|uniref:Uncharacterized protein n=1 Tax=Vespula germanica TaxID=30212 RepID=A0A834MW30_VESGE|nr:hypothetical protein HZH68_013084 [Vespula germanica]